MSNENEKPSRWHKWGQIPVWKDGHCITHESGWVLITTHHDTPSTKTAKIGCNHYCAYCANRAKTLQGNYDRGMTFGSDFTYATTGYTCDCSGARAEREFLLEEYELK